MTIMISLIIIKHALTIITIQFFGYCMKKLLLLGLLTSALVFPCGWMIIAEVTVNNFLNLFLNQAVLPATMFFLLNLICL